MVSVSMANHHPQQQPQTPHQHPEQAAYKDYPQQHAGHQSWDIGQRQGALLGHPIITFLPIILLIGVGAILLIPLLIMLFSPMSGYGGAGGGFGGFGKKRSITDDYMRKNLLELVVQFSDAIEKYGGSFFDTSSSTPSKDKKK